MAIGLPPIDSGAPAPVDEVAGPSTKGAAVGEGAVFELASGASRTERLQQESFDAIAEDYERHAWEPINQEYRRRFIDGPATEGIDLRGARVLEALSGAGYSTGFLQEMGARVVGLDISMSAARRFHERWPKASMACASALSLPFASCSFDCVLVIGGLHHLYLFQHQAIDEIHRILKPGGWLSFYEPHKESLVDPLRRLWYRLDPLFTETEEAINLPALRQAYAQKFEFICERYGGNVAYIMVLNALVLRLPHWLKGLIARPVMALESVLDKVLGRRLACAVTAQWRKRGLPAGTVESTPPSASLR